MGGKELAKRVYFAIRGFFIGLFARRGDFVAGDADNVFSILVIRIDRIGDVVLSLPAIRALKSMFPNASISVLANRTTAPILRLAPYVSDVIVYDGFLSSLMRLRSMKFDIAVDLRMDYSIRTALLAYLSSSRVLAGFDIESRGRFFDITAAPDTRHKQMSEHMLDLVRVIGSIYAVADRADYKLSPDLVLTHSVISRAKGILNSNGIAGDDLVITFHPGGHYPSQCWMKEGFAELADRAVLKYNAKVVLIGSRSEGRLIREIASMMKARPIIVIGQSLDESAAIISLSDILVCNNSGLLHVASALGVPTVSTMGPTVPYLWWPLGDKNIVIRKDINCSPCSLGSCDIHKCMKGISVDDMEAALSGQMKRFVLSKDGVNDSIKTKKGKSDNSGKLEGINKILIINLGGIGDVILSTPALRALKSTYPGAKLYFLGIRRANEFVRNLNYIDEVIEFGMNMSPVSILKNIKVIFYLRSLKIDLAINMRTLVSRESAVKFKIFLRSIAPRIAVGRDTDGVGDFFHIKIPESRIGDKPEMEYDMEMASLLGAEIVDKRIDFTIGRWARDKVQSMLDLWGVGEKDIIIGIHPGGKLSHRWPAERFAEVINMISSKMKAKFIITGDAADRSLVKKIRKFSKVDIIDATGKLTLEELGCLIERLRLYISNDTSAMHIAAVLDVPSVAIFGPGYIKRFDPRNISKNAFVVSVNYKCAPCDKNICMDMGCLKAIGAEKVVSVVYKILNII